MLKDEYEEKGGKRMAALLRSILKSRVRCENARSERRDFDDMLASWDKDSTQHRIVADADLQHAVQAAYVMEHAQY